MLCKESRTIKLVTIGALRPLYHAPLAVRLSHRVTSKESTCGFPCSWTTWGFPKLWALFGSTYNKGYNIFGVFIGVTLFWETTTSDEMLQSEERIFHVVVCHSIPNRTATLFCRGEGGGNDCSQKVVSPNVRTSTRLIQENARVRPAEICIYGGFPKLGVQY